MSSSPRDIRTEVLQHLDNEMVNLIPTYLKPVVDSWHPADFLPSAHDETFFDRVRELQERASTLSYDLLAVLIADTITEEALPSYDSWLSSMSHINQNPDAGLSAWVRGWTAEESRHGDVLSKYLYLCGRVNMKQVEISTQYLLADGFDIQTSRDPYRTFFYTSFQELATNVSHRRVAELAKKSGDDFLAKVCGNIAADEARHASAYKAFVSLIFDADPSEMMLAFEDMMKKKIVMPAHFLREEGRPKAQAFTHFSEVAQRLGVYTTEDYIEILQSLIRSWKVADIEQLTDPAKRARDYIVKLPDRLTRLLERSKPSTDDFKFDWIYG